MLAFVGLIAVGVSYVAYVLWPRWPIEPVTLETPALPITVAGVTFNLKPTAIRQAALRRSGNQDRVDLVFLWPSLEPPDPAKKHQPGQSPLEIDRIFLTISGGEGTLPPAERVKSIYPRYVAAEAFAGPDGLAIRAFRNDAPYRGEDLVFDPAAPDVFLVRCTRNGAAGLRGTCLFDRRIADADLTFRFPRDWLDDWRSVAQGIDRLIASLRPSAR